MGTRYMGGVELSLGLIRQRLALPCALLRVVVLRWIEEMHGDTQG